MERSAAPSLGQIGLGAWGARVFSVLAETGSLRAVATSDAGKVPRKLARTIVVHATPAALFADPAVDAVIVTTPPSTHAELVEAALRAGKHVLVEKPFGATSAEAVRCRDLAAERDLRLGVGFVYRHAAAYDFLLGLGEIASASTWWSKTGSFADDLFSSLGCHELALLEGLLGGLGEVTVREIGHRTATDGFFAQVRTGDSSGTVAINRTCPVRHKSVTVTTPAGETFEWCEEQVRRLEPAGRHWTVVHRSEGVDPLRRQIDDFVAACREGRAPKTDADLAIRVRRAYEESAR